MSNSVLTAALQLAANGRPVFPCLPNKRPACTHGYKDACKDAAAIEKLWREFPGALIGVCTGAGSGFDVLDLDAKHEEAKTWWRDNRRRIPRTRMHRTRSGGFHLLFEHDDAVRCGAGKIALGVDTRASGGYVIWWPATGLPVLSSAPTAPWPDWLLAEFRPKPRPASTTANTTSFRGDGWVRGLVRTVANAVEGQRNTILFWAACRGGEAVRAGKAGEDFIADVLVEAAARAGLAAPEARRTVQSGIRRT